MQERGESGEHLDEDVREADREHGSEQPPIGDMTDGPADEPGGSDRPTEAA